MAGSLCLVSLALNPLYLLLVDFNLCILAVTKHNHDYNISY